MTETVTLWRPTGKAELDLVAKSGWKEWPPRLPEQPIFYPVLNRPYATRIAREWNVPSGGVGFVTRFDVRADFLRKYPVQKVGGKDILEYWIPAEELGAMNENIVGVIRNVAEYRGPVPDAELAAAEQRLRVALPQPWRDYLRQPSRLAQGWLSDDCFLTLQTPRESQKTLDAWAASARHPGLWPLGTDGASEHLVLDLREKDPPVQLLHDAGEGWSDAMQQAPSLAVFLAQVEAGTFRFQS